MIKTQTLKGFRDFLPEAAIKRQSALARMKTVFEQFGFDPLETPALEYAETLLGKYGEGADKLLYLFEDHGGRKVGMRYDQTVPLVRVISANSELPIPFKRYQIQPVWRAENTQKGRYREFLQCDIDTVGSDAPLSDAEIVDCTLKTTKALGITDAIMSLNDRTIFDALALTKKDIITLDKLDKIGRDAVVRELGEKIFKSVQESKPTDRLLGIMDALTSLGYKEGTDFRFEPFLARGLDYYTSTIFELKIKSYTAGSVAGGGRYDKLIGAFTGRDMPAVGIAFGFDRMLEALSELHLVPTQKTATQVLVAVVSPHMLTAQFVTIRALRDAGINAELYPDPEAKLEKQLKYADKKGIPYVVIQGPDEAAHNTLQLKNMQKQTQEELSLDAVINRL